MADLATLVARLEAAENAYHLLMTGGTPTVVVDQNGERVEYARANVAALRNYILTLQAQIASLTGVAVTGGPLRPLF